MKRIVLEDQESKEVVVFQNLNFEYDDVLRRISFRLIVDFDIFHAEVLSEAEESDFLNMKQGLEKMLEFKIKTLIFMPIGDRLSIQFDLVDTGQVRVSLIVFNEMFTGKLNIRFYSDLSVVSLLRDNLNLVFENEC